MEKNDINNNTNSIAPVLSGLLQYHSISFRRFADALGIKHPYLFRLTKGQHKNPGIDIISKIADFFKISIPQLLGKEKIDFDSRPKDLNELSPVDYNKLENKQIIHPNI